MELRPLTLGEMLDRAVTLGVRNILTFSLIYLAFTLPLAIFQLYGMDDQSKAFGGLLDLIRSNPGKPIDPQALSQALGQAPVFNGFTIAWLVWGVIVGPLPVAALLVAVSRAYLGEHVTFLAAYREGVRFWLPLIGVNIVYFFAIIAFYVAFVLIGLMCAFLVVLAALALKPLAIVIGVAFGLTFFVGFLIGMLLAFIALYQSYFACVVERESFFRCFTHGVQRVFAWANIKYSTIVALAYGAISFGVVLFVFAGQAVLYGVFRSNVAGTAFGALASVVIGVFVTSFFAVYYYDVRIRREGFDLQREAAVLASD